MDQDAFRVHRERWPLRGAFRISRGAKTYADVLVVEIKRGNAVGRGECVPYWRYGETLDSVEEALHGMRDDLAQGLDRDALQDRLARGAARNAIDCALWDLEAKQRGLPAWRLAGLTKPVPVETAFTLSLDVPERMARL